MMPVNKSRAGQWLLMISFPVVAGICAGAFFFLDRPMFFYCKTLNPKVVAAFKFITQFGLSPWYLVPSLILFLGFKFIHKNDVLAKKFLFLFLAVACSGLVTDLIKYIGGRYRPKLLLREHLYGFSYFQTDSLATSFPSGHSTVAAAAMVAMYFIFPKYKYVYLVLAILIATSRIITGAHYFSDVLFGCYLGVVITILLKRFLQERGFHFSGNGSLPQRH